MLSTILAGAIMAVSLSAPPGPVAIETVRRGIGGGFRPALLVQLGSIIGDVTWCSLALLGLAPLVQIEWIRIVLSVVGVAVLVYLGAAGLSEAFGGLTGAVPSNSAGQSRGGAFRTGLVISMANPMAIGYWLSVGGALVAAGVAGTTMLQTGSFIAGFLGGTLAWAIFFALAVRWGRVLLTPRTFRLVTAVCSGAMLAFGAALALHVFGALG